MKHTSSSQLETGRQVPLAKRVMTAALAGVLALGLAPIGRTAAVADDGLQAQSADLTTQHYDYVNTTGKVLSDTLSDGVVRVDSTDADQVYEYMGYVHSDGSHYGPYSLYTYITTDANGYITALDMTSGNDMWTGKWGAKGSNPAIEGYLPDGVNFEATHNTDGTWTPTLRNAGLNGYSISDLKVTFLSVNSTGTADALGVNQNPDGSRTTGSGQNQTKLPVYTSTDGSVDSNGNITVPSTASGVVTSVTESTDSEGNTTYALTTGDVVDANYYNVVKCAYTLYRPSATVNPDDKNIDKVTFNTYFTVGTHSTDGDDYIDTIEATTWKETDVNTTNRDGWTGLTATLALRMLGSWNAWLQNSSVSTGLDGELASIDTVSGATKTSDKFVRALNQAYADGYVKGVAEDVAVTIDKNDASLDEIDINSKPQDGTTVTKNNDGTYTVNAHHRLYGGGRLSFLNVYPFNLSDKSVGTVGMKELAKATYHDTAASDYAGEEAAPYQYLKSYNETDTSEADPDKVAKLVAFGSAATEPTTVTAIGDDDPYISLTYTNDGARAGNDMPITLTTKSADVTHVVFRYLLGHATFSIAYDLEAMSQVSDVSAKLAAASAADEATVTSARTAYDALPYDVRPFTSGLANLKAQEAAIAAAKAATTVSKGDTATVSSQSFTVTKAATDSAQGAVAFTKSKNAKKVTVPATVTLADGKTYKVTTVNAKAFTGSKVRQVTIGKNVTKIAKNAFKGSKATKVTLKTTSLKKSGVKGSLKGSKVKTVKAPKKKVAAYTKIFTKKNCGKKVTVK